MLWWEENKLDGLSRREKMYVCQLLRTQVMPQMCFIYHHLHVLGLTALTFINAHVIEPCKTTVILGKEYKRRAFCY